MMSSTATQFHQRLVYRFNSLLPKQDRKVLQIASSPYKWAWNPHISLCLFVQNSKQRYLITGYDYSTAVIYAIRISWSGKVERGVFTLLPLLQQRNLVRMEAFKPQAWFQYLRQHGR